MDVVILVFLRPKWGSANYFYEYNTPLDDLKFILSLKTADDLVDIMTGENLFRYFCKG